MTYIPTYYEATNPLSPDGCFEAPDHEGQHRGWNYDKEEDRAVYWDDAPVIPEGSAALVLTDAELGILLTTLDPVKHFFPDLQLKIVAARAGLQK